MAAAEIRERQAELDDDEAAAIGLHDEIAGLDACLEAHTGLEKELRKLKANIRETEKKKDELVEAAREKITPVEAKRLILERFERLLTARFEDYLQQYLRGFVAAVENLWDKYAVTAKEILAERDQAAEQLDHFLVELGYD